MKTTYSNVKNPKRLTWILSLVVIIGYAAYIAYIAMLGVNHPGWQILMMILYLAGIAAFVWIPLTSVKCTVDDEEGTLFTPENLIQHLLRINPNIKVESKNYF